MDVLKIVVCIDCENLKKLVEKKEKEKIVTYSINDKEADIFAYDINVENGKTSYNVAIKGKDVGRYTISIPGHHNILNSLPVIYYAKKFGVDEEFLKKALENFKDMMFFTVMRIKG